MRVYAHTHICIYNVISSNSNILYLKWHALSKSQKLHFNIFEAVFFLVKCLILKRKKVPKVLNAPKMKWTTCFALNEAFHCDPKMRFFLFPSHQDMEKILFWFDLSHFFSPVPHFNHGIKNPIICLAPTQRIHTSTRLQHSRFAGSRPDIDIQVKLVMVKSIRLWKSLLREGLPGALLSKSFKTILDRALLTRKIKDQYFLLGHFFYCSRAQCWIAHLQSNAAVKEYLVNCLLTLCCLVKAKGWLIWLNIFFV